MFKLKFNVFILLLFTVSTNYLYGSEIINSVEKNNEFSLTKQQKKMLAKKISNSVPECWFLDDYPIDNKVIVEKDVFDCIQSTQQLFYKESFEKKYFFYDEVVDFDVLDDYLFGNILPYAINLDETDKALFMKRVMMWYSSRTNFINALLKNDFPTDLVTVRNIGDGSHWGDCSVYERFIKKNIELYKNKNTLYQPLSNLNNNTVHYRYDDLYFLTSCGSNICPNAIRILAQASPDSLNIQGHYGDYPIGNVASCPLKMYVLDFETIKLLATPESINSQDKYLGDTPLHYLVQAYKDLSQKLISTSTTEADYISFYEKHRKLIDLLVYGLNADIDIKNKEGVTVRDLLAVVD